jgi:hypothetical protein
MSRGCSGGFGRFFLKPEPKLDQKRHRFSWGALGRVGIRGTLQVHPCKLRRRIHAAQGPGYPPSPALSEISGAFGEQGNSHGRSRSRAPVLVEGRKSCRAWLGTTAACMRAWGGRRLALVFALAFAVPCEPTHCPRAGLCGLPGPCVAMDGNTEPPWTDLRRAPETHTGLPSPAQARNRCCCCCCCCCSCRS